MASQSKILIIDDEDLFREDLGVLIEREGYQCQTAATAEEGLSKLAEFKPDIVLCDIVMPGKSGIQVLEEIGGKYSASAVIMMTAFGTLETAIEAFRQGAIDYVIKPLVTEDLLTKIGRILEHKQLLEEIKYLRRKLQSDTEAIPLIGESRTMKSALQLIEKVAPTGSTVLITGESGTGKELVARTIHAKGGNSDEPFVAINCSGFQETLLESELFGHVKGAFTGAVQDKEGFFEVAGRGTIFLDEISEMPLPLQSKLLRVLEQREFYRVGGTKAVSLQARIVAATNRGPKKLVQEGMFRDDLFYRLAVFEIDVPPLRERASDVPLLVDYFMEKFNREMNLKYETVASEAMQALMSYEWPGNIRELRNLIERAMILCDGRTITLDGLPRQTTGGEPRAPKSQNLREAMEAYEGAYLRKVLSDCGWNKEEAARRLGVNPSTLYRKMSHLEIADPTTGSSLPPSEA